MIRSGSFAEMDVSSTQIERDQRLSQNCPLDFDDTTNKEVPAQGAGAGDVTSKQSSDKVDGLRVCVFELHDVGHETVERFNGVLVEKGV